MPSAQQKVKKALLEMGLPDENLEQAVENILSIRERMAPVMDDFKTKGLLRSLALSQDLKAIRVIDEITDVIVQQRGVLELAMHGKDIHDELATIKAKIISLITGEREEPNTLNKLKSTTQRMARFKRPTFSDDDEDQ